jgi:hypothetical protein
VAAAVAAPIPSNSKEFAQLAAKQAALRDALRKLQKEKQEQGKGDKALDDIMDEMNKIEIDLVNKNFTNDMLQRQEQILTRLLEHEKAEREREQDEQRRSRSTARQQQPKMPPALEEYLKKRRARGGAVPHGQPCFEAVLQAAGGRVFEGEVVFSSKWQVSSSWNPGISSFSGCPDFYPPTLTTRPAPTKSPSTSTR